MSSKKNGYCFTRKQVRCRYTQIHIYKYIYYIYIYMVLCLYRWFTRFFNPSSNDIPPFVCPPDGEAWLPTFPLDKAIKHLCLLSAGYTTIHNQHSLELHPKGMISLFHQHAGLGSKPYYFGHVETPDQMTSYTPFPWAKFWKSRFLLIFDFWSPILCGWNQSNHRSGSSCKIRWWFSSWQHFSRPASTITFNMR